MGTVPPPLMDSRKSVMSANRANMCVPRFDQKPKLSKQLAPPHHDSPTHSQHRNRFSTVEDPLLDSRESIASTTRAIMCASIVHRGLCDSISRQQSIGVAGYSGSENVAPSLSGYCADCARQPAHSRHLVSMVENSITSTNRATIFASIGVPGYVRSAILVPNGPRRRAIAPRHSDVTLVQTVRWLH